MKKNNWLKHGNDDFFSKKTKKKKDKEFSPERALKLAGGAALIGVGLHVATEVLD